MELIKKIKEAEASGREIVEQAKSEAADMHEEGKTKRREAQEQAQQERKNAIEAAIAAAQSKGSEEVEQLKAQSEQNRLQLRNEASGKMPAAVTKVMDYIRG